MDRTTTKHQKVKFLIVMVSALALFLVSPFTGNPGQWTMPGIATIEAAPVTGRLLVETDSYFCMGAQYGTPGASCVALDGGSASGIVLGQQQPQSLQPFVCANNGGGTGYAPKACISYPSSITKPFKFFGSGTYISTNPISWQSCITHFAPSADTGADVGGGCLALTADLGGWEVFWNGAVFQQGPRWQPGVNLFAEGKLCSDDTYELDWPAKIVGGPFNGVTGNWRLRGHLNACVDTTCDDNNPCTVNNFDTATCQCDFTTPTTCDDGNECTDDTCDPLSCDGCVYTNNTATCTQDNPVRCYTGTTCSDGVCGTLKDCDDNNVCTVDSCTKFNGNCSNVDRTDTYCSDNNICTTDTCDPVTGECSFADNTDSCSIDLCLTDDACSGGVCVAGSTPKACDDNNPCTDDSCDAVTGACIRVANAAACTPSDPLCFIGATCANKVCGTPKDCNDNNVCTDDSCEEGTGVCLNANNTAECVDNDACMAGDTCAGGACGAGPYALNCNDWNVCTDDSCAPGGAGCVYVNNADPCTPTNGCWTGATCSGGECGTPINCDDSNACTTDFCNIMTGACENKIVDCDDGNVCTDDVCNPGTGVCEYTNNAGSCDDNRFCNGNDTCSGGTCSISAGDPCLSGCDEVNDQCLVCVVDADCVDIDICTTQVCVATVCTYPANIPPACDDNDICTIDGCTADACTNTATVPLACDDNEICTTDSCTADTCSNTNNTDPCDDGLYCTDTDICAGGTCGGSGDPCSPPLVCDEPTDQCICILDADCDDSDQCTNDACVSGSCTNTATVPPACDDNDMCTIDGCTADACTNTATVPPACDDNEICTTDSCTADTCTNTNNTEPCDDGDLCTTSDACSGGTCDGTAVDCDDNDACTTDACDPATGACVNSGSCGGDGDIDGDGDTDVNDALKALRIAAGIDTATADELSRGDVAPLVDGTPAPDGTINIGDVVVVLRKAIGLVSW